MLTWIETDCGPQPPVTEGITWKRRTPSPALCHDVVAISGYREDVAHHLRQIQAASLTVTLVLCFGEPFSIGRGQTSRLEPVGWSFAAGMSTVPVIIDSFGAASCITVQFTPPGARRFFQVPMHELADHMIAFGDVLGCQASSLLDELASTAGWDEQFDIVEAFLIGRLRDASYQPSPTAWAFERLLQTGGRERIGNIVGELGWSRKHLAAKFREEIGLTPKTVARMARFDVAVSRARRIGPCNWAQLATECGYADQAHLTRDFSAFRGATPAAWQSQLVSHSAGAAIS